VPTDGGGQLGGCFDRHGGIRRSAAIFSLEDGSLNKLAPSYSTAGTKCCGEDDRYFAVGGRETMKCL
jgi:hypothetical protein